MTKEELQRQSVSLIEQNNRVALQWCTGLGKSKAAIDMANYLANKEFKECGKSLNVLLVVAETAHKSNWKEEIDRWKLKTDNVVMECYASLKKYRNSYWDLIIFDEAHHLGSDLRMDVLTELNAKNIILLSATLPDQVMQTVTEVFGKFVTSKVTLKEAIEWGVLPKPKVYLIPLTLNNTQYNCTIIEEWGKKEKRVTYKCKFHERWKYLKDKKKYPNIKLEISCTQQQKYDYLSDKFNYWKRQYFLTQEERVKTKMLQTGLERKRFLGECKTDYVKLLLYKLRNMRYICFCTNIKQAELLGNKNAIHSEKKDSLEILNQFNFKKINNLFAVGMLQEGQNLVDIEAGIIVQLDGKERAFIQKFGRGMRAEDPIQFLFYYKNTKDIDYLQNVLEGIDENYIVEVNSLINLKL